jgi:hypothetical protein
MKTGKFFLLLLTAFLSCTWQTGQSEIIKVNGINYELDDSNMTAAIAGGQDYRGVNIHIVRTVKKDKKDYAVVDIQNFAFLKCPVENITYDAPSNLKRIGASVF